MITASGWASGIHPGVGPTGGVRRGSVPTLRQKAQAVGGFWDSARQGPAMRDLRVEVDVGAKLRLYGGMELILLAAGGAYD